jgi:ABC-type polysaccharide/polyol phosphate transport system ATPase subunit
MAEDLMIRMQGVWKRYGLGLKQNARRIWHSLKREAPSVEEYGPWALLDINLEVRRGEALGIIGRNGAGKSTLLKILAGVSPHTRGQVEVRGQVFPMIELNAGLNMDLTGRENVYLLGTVMGLSPALIKARLPQIEEFCELGEYFERPVRTYSSGMLARLGFGVAINVDADILLVDEVLSVGDFAFKNKCLTHFRKFRQSGQTLLYVTHNLVQLPYICDETIYLDNGRVKAAGLSQEVTHQYEKDSLLQTPHQVELPLEGVHRLDTTGHLKILSARVTNCKGQVISEVGEGQSFCFVVEGVCHALIETPIFAFAIYDSTGVVCWWNLSTEDGYIFNPLQGRFKVTARVPSLPLRTGRYTIVFTLRDGEGYIHYERIRLPYLTFRSKRRAHGILSMGAEWHLERGLGDTVLGANETFRGATP